MTDIAHLASLKQARTDLGSAIGSRVVGQIDTVESVLTALFAGGHALLLGAPGLAKTRLVGAVAEALGWSFRRIQFTPDLMPSDITGSEVLREDKASGVRELTFMPGPVFANILLADEINRAPPKTQAALLEAMQEQTVTIGGKTYPLPQPFFVLATQNPIEHEGTYPLPEAQLDRFLACIRIGYPNLQDELAIAALDGRSRVPIATVLTLEDFQGQASLIARIPVPDVALRLAVGLCRGSRPDAAADPWVREHVAWGAGPRASQALVAAARARAGLHGQAAVTVADIRACASMVLAHRLVPTFHAAGHGIDGPAIVTHLLAQVQA